MKVSSNAWMTAGLVLAGMTTICGAAAAGDLSYGAGLARQAVPAVPVPAPVPVPDTYGRGYYVRVDAAWSNSDASRYTSSDSVSDGFRSEGRLDQYGRYGLGIGTYFTKWLRGDITVDFRTDVESRGYGAVNYTATNVPTSLSATPNNQSTTIALRDTYNDSFRSMNSTGMANLYVDVPVWGEITPYVGAGIGFVRHRMWNRQFSRVTTCQDSIDCDPTVNVNSGSTAFNSTSLAVSGGVDYALAAAAMAGVSFPIGPHAKLDIGYRYLYLQGTSYANRIQPLVQTITIPDQNTHEARVGVRWDFN